MVRQIDLTCLPKWETGTNKGKINWKKSIGCKCKFKYDDIEGELEIVDYTSKGQKLTIKYLDYDLFETQIGRFSNCEFGKLFKKYTNEFKIEIGQNFKDSKRNITIIDKEYRIDKSNIIRKYYKYNCNLCGNKDWKEESSLLKGIGCNACYNRKPLLGFNTIYDTDKWMIDLGISEEDSKKYTSQSSKKVKVKCPNCGKEKYISINHIYRRKSIGCLCGDGISYPEKFVISLLEQLDINYIKEYSPEWIKPKRYDFYFKLNNKRCIVETHGKQHYIESGTYCKNGGLQEEQKNDRYKKELALNNGINYYIELDCRESSLDYIKNSILNSDLNIVFDLTNINWFQCEEFALSNRVKEVCDYWRLHNEINSEEFSSKDLGKVFNLNDSTIRRYLNKGNKLGWCNYNSKKELIKSNSKTVKIFDKNKKCLGVFKSCHELERQSEKLFGVKLLSNGISAVATGNKKYYKGFIFKYVNKKENYDDR